MKFNEKFTLNNHIFNILINIKKVKDLFSLFLKYNPYSLY